MKFTMAVALLVAFRHDLHRLWVRLGGDNVVQFREDT